ncbi:MAG: YtxH domain-containing protein [Paludibacteraceae bacterium]|nr:YtxH domain-containing protein [Bacteroidales bacterium]MDY4149742.1 YtxH domain-containing protein [Paludibacteraceae bacterium]
MANLGKVLAAFAGGAVLGAAAALLFAPKSGEEIRRQIADLAREKGLTLSKDELESFVGKVLAKVKGCFTDDELKAAVDEAIADSKA